MELEKYTAKKSVQGLPDRPKNSAAELKAKFDEAEKNIGEYINEKLIPEINKNFEGAKTYIDEKDKAIMDELGEHVNDMENMGTDLGGRIDYLGMKCDRLSESLSYHVVNYEENPHNVTASQIPADKDSISPPGTVGWELQELGLSIKAANEGLELHAAQINNPHKVTKEQIGLGNVDNTSDIDKPISNAMKEALGKRLSFSYVMGDVDDCYMVGSSHLYYVFPLGVGTEEELHYMLSVTENQPQFIITFPLSENYYSLKATQYKFVTSDIKMRTGVLNYKEYNGEHTLISKEWHEWKSVEMTRNKVAVIDKNSTDEQYPSAKAVYDYVKSNSTFIELNVNDMRDFDDINHHKIEWDSACNIIYKGLISGFVPYVLLVQICWEDVPRTFQTIWVPDGMTRDVIYQKRCYGVEFGGDDTYSQWTEWKSYSGGSVELTFDDTPTEGSSNLLTSGTIYNSLGDVIKTHCWKGKKVIFLGDSIAQGYTDKGNVQNPFPKVVANNLEMTMTNYGIGGSTVAQQENYGGAFKTRAEFDSATKDTSKIYQVITGQGYTTYEYNTETTSWETSNVRVRTPLSARYEFMSDDTDLVIVQGGTNDFQYDWTPVGTMADRTVNTFYGALHTMLTGLIEKYKGKTIVFLTPLKRSQSPYATPEAQNTYGLTLSDYRNIILEVCDYYGIPVIDVFSISGLNPYLEANADLFDSVKTHPLQWGHNRLGDIISTGLLGIQRFDTAGVIEDDGDDENNEPIVVTWHENTALGTSSSYVDSVTSMNYRTTTDYVSIPKNGLTITLIDDDLEMCVYSFNENKVRTASMDTYLSERTYSVNYDKVHSFVKVMVRSKSNPNGKLITVEEATAGVIFTAE